MASKCGLGTSESVAPESTRNTPSQDLSGSPAFRTIAEAYIMPTLSPFLWLPGPLPGAPLPGAPPPLLRQDNRRPKIRVLYGDLGSIRFGVKETVTPFGRNVLHVASKEQIAAESRLRDSPSAPNPNLDPESADGEDLLETGRPRDPKTGRFVAPCPSSRTPGPCHQSVTSHFVYLWPGALSDDETGSYFDATQKPWSDREARNIVFGNVPAFYFGGGRLERKGDSLLDRATV